MAPSLTLLPANSSYVRIDLSQGRAASLLLLPEIETDGRTTTTYKQP